MENINFNKFLFMKYLEDNFTPSDFNIIEGGGIVYKSNYILPKNHKVNLSHTDMEELTKFLVTTPDILLQEYFTQDDLNYIAEVAIVYASFQIPDSEYSFLLNLPMDTSFIWSNVIVKMLRYSNTYYKKLREINYNTTNKQLDYEYYKDENGIIDINDLYTDFTSSFLDSPIGRRGLFREDSGRRRYSTKGL